ncbi:uracil-DNA glycosylase-like [Sycon ciliatum]|uniref:uracil-DNA glycosylase-like n=1 Tax=Sycon ciliatum TaxID=27933 RepID=UPI0031F65636
MAQTSLHSFFKRPASMVAAAPPAKRVKTSAESCSSSSSASDSQSTQAVLERAELNRQAALERRRSSQSSSPGGIGNSWKLALAAEFSESYYTTLQKFVASERQSKTIYPPEEEVFSWSNLCRAQDVKVVILGQDPYHGPNQAHGLCFSVKKGQTPPPSLRNMYTELERDLSGFKRPKHGDLSTWAQQGVLLLNTVLTVRAHEANSHQGKGWEKLTDAVISWLNKNLSGVVFLLWGKHAQTKGASIDKRKHHVLTCVHPSPLSAHRGFIGCGHFTRANELLCKQQKTPIDWASICDENWTHPDSTARLESPPSSQPALASPSAPTSPDASVKESSTATTPPAQVSSPPAKYDPTQEW